MAIKDKILQQCSESFLKFGIRSISMDDIARSIGISKKTIYTHFDKKDGLIMKAVQYIVSKDEQEIESITNESIDAVDEMISIARHVLMMFRKMSPSVVFDLQKYYPQVWKLVDEKHFEFIYATIKKNIERGVIEGYYRSDIDADIVSKFYVQLTVSIVDQHIFPLSEYERTPLLKQLIMYHLNSILSPKGKEYLIQQEII
jgi:AcrR family transcriptional regulator